MSDMTPGQALYAVISERFIDEDITDWSKWDELENSARDVYEDAAKAAITAGAAAETRPRVDWARVSEAVADRERERDEAREQLAALRGSVAGIAEGLEHRAEINRPSRVSEVCDGIAGSLRGAVG